MARTSAIGNIDDDPPLEIIVTFDNHQINAFNLDGTSILTSNSSSNRETMAAGRRMGWGQFIRYATRGWKSGTTTSTPMPGPSTRRRGSSRRLLRPRWPT